MGKVATVEAASRLGLHPANMVLYLSPMVTGLEDCWPEVDEGFIDTIRTIRQGSPVVQDRRRPSEEIATRASDHLVRMNERRIPVLSDHASHVLIKLHRKIFWGSHTVTIETIKNVFCQNIHRVEDAVQELIDADFIVQSGHAYSLNQERKKEIDQIVRVAQK